MKFVAALFTIFFCSQVFAQADLALFKNNSYGRPLYQMSNRAVEGSPYYSDDYIKAQIIAVNGNVYNGIKVKINIADNLLQYLGENGEEMITDMPVKKIVFIQSAEEKNGQNNVSLQSIDGAINKRGAVVYELLDSGKISLLKKISISSREDQKYGESTVTTIYERHTSYYFLKENGKEQKLEKGKSAILELFNDRKDKITAFINHYNLDFKNESAYKDVFNFYNSLNQN